jgi:DNA invertase Pin-like site-specific DNA recombinase
MKIVGYVRTTGIEERTFAGGGACPPNPPVRPIEEQETILRVFARQEGHHLVATYRDTGLPQGDRSTRAGLMSLLDSMEEGWEAVLVVGLDRLATRDVSLDVLQELRENGKRWLVIGEPAATQALANAKKHRPHADSPSQRLPRTEPRDRPFSSGPHDDRHRLAERLLRGREAGARAGKHQSGPAPYGYRRDYGARGQDGVLLKMDDIECEIVRYIFREYLRVRSMKRLIQLLEDRDCRTRRGKRWSRAGVSWILKNDTYVGRVHFGSIRTRGRHTPIVSPIIFNKVQKLIRQNDKRKKHDTVVVTHDEAVVAMPMADAQPAAVST